VNVALAQVDGVHHNLALMKLAAHHLAQGDQVVMFDQIQASVNPPDRLYVAKVFDFTPDLSWWPAETEIIRGGTGYDRGLVGLPADVEGIMPAYDFFGCDHAVGFISRGCVNQCPFCLVPMKEGRPHIVADLDDFWQGQSHVRLLDPNITALGDDFCRLLERLAALKLSVDFNQGLDARLMTQDQAVLLRQVKIWDRNVHLSWDRLDHEAGVKRGLDRLMAAGFHPSKLVVNVLVGFNSTPEQDLYRIDTLRSWGCTPWVMPFDRPDADPMWKRYATAVKRWGSRSQFRSLPFAEYEHGPWKTTRDLPWVAGLDPSK
jgi:hypothetical protein